jgi:hypothetical protein
MVTFDGFLNDILHLAPEWVEKNTSWISGIVQPKSFGNIVSKYQEPVTHETSHYPPFINLTNFVVDRLDHNPGSSLCFFRNNPVIVGGSCAERKPDVTCVCNESLEVDHLSTISQRTGQVELVFGGWNCCCSLSSNSSARAVRGSSLRCMGERLQFEYVSPLGLIPPLD